MISPRFPPATFTCASGAMNGDVFIPRRPPSSYTFTRMSENGMTPAILDHFLNPRNVGDVAEADGVGEVGAGGSAQVTKLHSHLGALDVQ